MPKLQVITTNFTAGEFSPRLRGRVDLERYNASGEVLQNVVVLRQGGVTIRPSRDYKGEIKSSAVAGRIIPFIYSRTDAYLLELGETVMRVWKAGALVESSPGVPFEIATPWTAAQLAALDFTQGADTLIVAHPDVPTQRIRRFGDALWTCDAVPFYPPALDEIGHGSDTISMTLSSATVGSSRTLTASAAFFQPSDVGRLFTSGAGLAAVDVYTSATAVTVSVKAVFATTALAAGTWTLEGTPSTSLTPSVANPVGANTTLTLAVDGWRSSDVGKFVEVNGGLVELTAVSSALAANGVIKRELTGIVAAPRDAWVLLGGAWNASNGYPSSCTLFQQRLWLGGTRKFPQTMWGSRSGLFFDFMPGTQDDSAVYKTIDSDDINVIQYLVSAGQLLTLSYGGEFDTRGGIEKPITQLNAQITQRSRWGCEAVRPEQAGRDVLFVQRGGRALRALFKGDIEGFDTRDVSVFSEHLLRDGVRSIAWEQTPEQVLWLATSAGALLALTYSDEQTTIAFTSGAHDGAVEWLATIPEGGGDATYCLTRYTVNGATKRYVERLNWLAPPGQDARKEATAGAATVTWSGFGHLAGKTVALLADDIHVGSGVVSAGGVITLPRPASKVSAGIPYSARVRLQAPEVGTGTGTAQAQAMSTNQVWVRFLETVGCKVNGQALTFRNFDQPLTLDQSVAPFTGIKDVMENGWLAGESPIELVQDQPYPWTVLSVVRSMTVNQG